MSVGVEVGGRATCRDGSVWAVKAVVEGRVVERGARAGDDVLVLCRGMRAGFNLHHRTHVRTDGPCADSQRRPGQNTTRNPAQTASIHRFTLPAKPDADGPRVENTRN